jgi:DNA gyrase subunit A
MSVIISRAAGCARWIKAVAAPHPLRDARSPFPNRQHRKCAKICGDTSGITHGEAVIYPTLMHMAQAGPCAKRSSMARATSDPWKAILRSLHYFRGAYAHLGAALMTDMDKDTVNFVPNYDRRTEPTVFAAFPNLLVNGGTGIAVGMATNIPPHNLGEVIDGISAQIDDPDIPSKVDEVRERTGLPDQLRPPWFSWRAPISRTGAAALKVRGKAGVEELRAIASRSSSPRFLTT